MSSAKSSSQSSQIQPVSGVYNIAVHEAAQDKKHSTVNVSVVLLDNSEVVFKVSKRDRGQILLDLVVQHARIGEVKFFGLQFNNNPETMRWLDPSKTIRKQFKRNYPYILFLRIKFYATDFSMMKEAITKYNLFLQLKLDILERKLQCSQSDAAKLSSLAVQSEFGDYDSRKHPENFLSHHTFIANQSEGFLNDVKKMHKLNIGLTKVEAERLFIQKAQTINMYGVEMHIGYKNDSRLDIGVDGSGIVLSQNNSKTNDFKWSTIVKISFKKKHFFIQLKPPLDNSEPTNPIEFHMDTYRSCKKLWKSCVDFHYFYRHFRCINYNCNHQQSEEKYSTSAEGSKLGSKSELGFTKQKEQNGLSNNHKYENIQEADETEMLRMLDINPVEVSNKTEECSTLQLQNIPVKQSTESLASHSSTERLPTPVQLPIQYHTFDGPPINAQHFHVNQEPTPSSAIQSNSTCANVLIKLEPDQDGVYGFNVTGGKDQNLPIAISRVTKGLPASKCNPPMQEGDLVLQVNGRDVSSLTHNQIVNLIQSTREIHTGYLKIVLQKSHDFAVKQELSDENCERSDDDNLEYQDDGSELAKSMDWLSTLCESGDIITMFQSLYRRKPTGKFEHSKFDNNVHKNRYRDISPYDDTRVILEDVNNDYINANYVNMEITGENAWTNRYIACQGPLPNTAVDFWTMVWEQKSTFIVMLTALMEGGRHKCHQYWPNLGDTVSYGCWLIQTIRDDSSNESFAFRDFVLHRCIVDEMGRATGVYETREIKQMQYIAWPDHGVPDDPTNFLDFVARVRKTRAEMKVPSIIHCSAGIGRTGVLITMETAMCLMEANQPIYPLQIAQRMRNQRAMMIQTALQFKFVCVAIIRVYREGQLKYCDMGDSVNEGSHMEEEDNVVAADHCSDSFETDESDS